jgi:hypothetical protein
MPIRKNYRNMKVASSPASRSIFVLPILVQLVVPLAMVWWVALPFSSLLEFICRIITALAALVLLRRTPGWWMTSMHWRSAVLPFFGLVSLFELASLPATSFWPGSGIEWLPVAITAVVLAYLVFQLWRTRTPRRQDAFDLGLPFTSGSFVFAGAGENPFLNQHARVLADEKMAGLRGQALGADLVGINSWGRFSKRPLPRQLDEFEIFGRTVTAPCAGTVRSVQDDLDDRTPGERHTDPAPGNHIWMSPAGCGDCMLLLAHLKKHSVVVRPGQVVSEGEVLGRVGNSGNSTEPHLHVHLQKAAPRERPFDADPLRFEMQGQPCAPNRILRAGS